MVERPAVNRRVAGWNPAVCLRARNSYEEAEPLLLHSYDVLKAIRGEQDGRTLQTAGELVELYESTGRHDDADTYRRLIGGPALSRGAG